MSDGMNWLAIYFFVGMSTAGAFLEIGVQKGYHHHVSYLWLALVMVGIVLVWPLVWLAWLTNT